MAGRRTTCVPTDMSISVMDDKESDDVVVDDDTRVSRTSTANRTVRVNPQATIIRGDRPSHETSWLHDPGDRDDSFMERVDLRGKVRDAELKLFRAENEISRLKSDLERRDSVIRCLQSRAQESLQTNFTQLRGEKRKSDAAKGDTEHWRRKLQERENELVALRKENTEAVSKLERQLREKDRLVVQKDDELLELKRTARDLRRAEEARKLEFFEMEKEVAELREATREARMGRTNAKIDQERKIVALEAELRQTNLTLIEAQQALKDMDDMKKLEKVFYTKLTDVPAVLLENEKLKKENALFRRSSEKALALEARTVDLQEEVDILKQRLAELANVSAEKALIDSRLAAWAVFASELVPDLRCVDKSGELGSEITPHHVAAVFALLQDESLSLVRKTGALQTQLNALNVELSGERGEKTATQNALRTVRDELESVRRRLTAALKQRQLLTLERDSCRRLLDSYQDDITSTFRPKDDRSAELEVLVEEYKKEVERLTSEVHNLETKLAATKGDSAASNSWVDSSSTATLTAKNSECQTQIESLEAANESLSREIANWRGAATSLRANVADLETQLQLAEASRIQLGNEVVCLKSEVAALNRKVGNGVSFKDEEKMRDAETEMLRREIADLRKQRAEALSDQLKTVEQFRALLKKKEVCDEERTKLEKMATNLKSALAEAEATLSEAQEHEKLIESDLNMSKTEVDTLKSCVEDMEVVQREAEASERELAAERDSLKEEVKRLEEDMESLKADVERADEEKYAMEEQWKSEKDRTEELKGEVERIEVEAVLIGEKLNREKKTSEALMADVERLQNELEKLRAAKDQEKEETEKMDVVEGETSGKVAEQVQESQPGPSERQGGGEIVVRLRDNPLAWQRQEREKEFDMLRAEVESLRRKLASAVASSSESSGTASLDVTTVAKEDEYSYKKIRDLQAALKRTEIMSERLRKSWKETSQEFREIVYQFSGYKLDKTGPENFKLTSMYAESPDDVFLFRRNNEGLLEFLESNFVEANKTSVECYLTKRNSIPGFLASVTLDLLSRETE